MRNKEKGFTLVEIIVVLVIIGILLAIAVPSILGYVKKTEDVKILNQAHDVLNSAKAKSVELYSKNELSILDKDRELWEEIVAFASVDGTLENLELNTEKNSSGDFILHIKDKYVYYYDSTNTFEIKDDLEDIATIIQKVHKEIMSNENVLSVIQGYFSSRPKSSIDSEGNNFAPDINKALKTAGFPIDSISWRIYQDKGQNVYTITISEVKVSKDKKGDRIHVTQFDYSGANGFDSTYSYKTKTGIAKVSVKNSEGKEIPYIDLSDTKWNEN